MKRVSQPRGAIAPFFGDAIGNGARSPPWSITSTNSIVWSRLSWMRVPPENRPPHEAERRPLGDALQHRQAPPSATPPPRGFSRSGRRWGVWTSAHFAERSPSRLTTEAPRLTTEAPRLTTEAPRLTTEAPRLTTEAPRLTTEAPRLTTEAPRLTTEAPRLTRIGRLFRVPAPCSPVRARRRTPEPEPVGT
jgi:hypothetical protein